MSRYEPRPLATTGDARCPLCGAELDSTSSACRRCGSTPGRVSQCLHCRTTASIRPHGELGWVCEVCGGARLVPSASEQEASVTADLTSATRSFRTARLLRTLSWILAIFGAGVSMLLLLTKLAFSPSAGTMATLSVVPLMVLVASVIGFVQVKALKAKTAVGVENALGSSLMKLVSEFPRGATAAQLANRLEISPTRAEQLLTRLNVRDDVQSIVTDDGQLLFRVRTDALPPSPSQLNRPATAQLRAPNESESLADNDAPTTDETLTSSARGKLVQ